MGRSHPHRHLKSERERERERERNSSFGTDIDNKVFGETTCRNCDIKNLKQPVTT
jgi:hypothetical protein